LLPDDQAQELRGLWEEFEAGVTADARFAAALDRIQPLLLQYHTCGKSWQLHGITSRQVLARNSRIRDISEELGRFVDDLIQECIAKEYLRK
jgi:putative hydrolase of HD superfamily